MQVGVYTFGSSLLLKKRAVSKSLQSPFGFYKVVSFYFGLVKKTANYWRVTLDPYSFFFLLLFLFKRTSVKRLVRDEKSCDHGIESQFHPGVRSRSAPRVLTILTTTKFKSYWLLPLHQAKRR